MKRPDGWIRERPDIPDKTSILIWHVFQGVLVCRAAEWNQNRFFACWRPVPEIGWTMATDRRPTKQDADSYNCVLARDAEGMTKVTGWHQFETNRHLIRWMNTPEPPEDYKELRTKHY